ncbi:MAG: gliding motility-associated C-terminal domain-containing protein [Bacteroidota bacterium]
MRNSSFWLLKFVVALVSFVGFAQEMDYNLDKHKMLIENKGQWDDQILFQSKFQGGNLWVQQHKLLFHLQDFSAYQAAHANFKNKVPNSDGYRQTVIHANFVGSNEVTEIEKEKPSEHYFNYFLGNDESKWARNVHSFHEVNLKQLYSGIDLKLIQTAEEMKYEFHVSPNSNPSQIKIQYKGQNSLKIDKKGELVIDTYLGKMFEKKPYAYQIVNGRIKEIPCEFKLKGDVIYFELGSYRKDINLVIDPILVFATYCGSVTDNFGMTATYGYDGSAYSGGMIYGNAYPVPFAGAYDITSSYTVPNNGLTTTDVFISKYNSIGTQMIWTNFLGGSNPNAGTETAQSMICDQQNNIYIYGTTSSTDFPVSNTAYQTTHNGGVAGLQIANNGVSFLSGGTDIFVTKLSSNGQYLLGSTFVGGSGNDGVNYNISGGSYQFASNYDSLSTNYGDQFRGEIMLDNLGNCIVGSCTRSSNFPTLNAVQSANAGQLDGVIFRLSNNLSTLQFSTYIGGANNDAVYSVKVDSSYNIVFAGGTSSINLPGTSGKYLPTYQGGKADGFVGKLNSNGSVLQGITYIGTTNYDQVFFVEIDRNDKIFITGQSRGGGFPINNSSYFIPNSNNFIAKLDENLTGLERSMVYGRSNSITMVSPSAFLVDRCGNIYVSGWGSNLLSGIPISNYPTTANPFGSDSSSTDFHLFVLDREFSTMTYGAYIGGNTANEHVDGGTSRFDRNGIVYQSVCGGCGGVSDFPTDSALTTNPYSSFNLSSNCNNLVFKFDFETQTEAQFTLSDTAICLSEPITLTNNSSISPNSSYFWILANGDTSTLYNPTLTFNSPGTYTIKLIVTDSICDQSDTTQIDVLIAPDLLLNVPNDTIICKGSSFDLIANSFGSASSFVWSTNPSFTDTLNPNPMDSVITVSPVGSQTYYVKIENGTCSKTESVQVLLISNSIQIVDSVSYCEGESKNITVVNLVPSLNFSYQWTPTSIVVGPSDQATVTTNTLISQYMYVTVSDGLGCSFEDSVWLDVHNIATISVSATANPAQVPVGGTTTLIADPPGVYYSWTPIAGLSNPNAQITQATVNKETEYTVVITDGICTNTAKVKVQVFEYVCDNPYIFVPNAFTPNADGENDILYVRGAILEKVLFRIFNRWGEMVFETTNKDIGWDGTFNGKMMDPDVYDYYLNAVCIDGQEKIIKGNVTIMR